MNDQEYIRAGIELADGWDITHIFAGEDIAAYNPKGAKYPEASFVLQSPSQSGLDTLAAQLVRQVDALAPAILFTSDFGGCVMLWQDSPEEDWHAGDCRNLKNNDRTMNTIKAIIDSEVLK